ncbi:hypothetical protein BGY98DRAFT_283289 [Russula aff. rugulosa BPL654]|nr:hypothetical protein BGY98DRAFT_283289 [Russula aff. rugulosa BPL654]
MTSMTPGSSDIYTFHKDGISMPDPGNPPIILKFVGTWSENDPSWEEARWQYYFDTGRLSLQTDPSAPSPSQDGELTTSDSICSQCAATLATSGKRDDETQGHGATTDSADTETQSVSRRRRFKNERGMGDFRSRSSKTGRRIRRLEKTVESLSHGLILALTQLKSGDMHADTEPHHHGSGPGPHHRHHRPGHSDVANHEIESVSRDHSAYYDDDDDDDRDLSTVFSRLGFKENSRGGIGTAAPPLQKLDDKSSPSLEENLSGCSVDYRGRRQSLLL